MGSGMESLLYWGNLVLSYGVSGYVMLMFMFEIFEPKYDKKQYFFIWIMFVILAIVSNMQNITLIKSSYGIFSIMIVGICFFKSTSYKLTIGVSLFFFLYMFICDTLSVLVLTVFSGKTVELIQSNFILLFICGIGNQVIFLCLYKPLVTIIKRNKFDAITIQQNLFLILLAFFEVLLLIYILKYIDTSSNSLVSMAMMLGFLGLDVYLIYLFESISEKYKLEKEIDLREQQEAMQVSYYNGIEIQYERSKRLIHDIKNHMAILEELYVYGSREEAEQYTKNIYKAMEKMENRFSCNNKTLMMIINDKLLQCDEKKIEIKIDIQDVNLNFINPFDITTIFSNLLDNAIEACEELPIKERKIDIKMFYFKDFLTVHIVNSCKEPGIKENNEYITTKQGHHMGLGLKNVKATVEKLEGSISFEYQKNQFCVKVLLLINK